MTDPLKPSSADNPDWILETDLRCTHDLTGRIISISAAAAQALGHKREDLRAISLRDLIVPQFRDRFDTYLAAIQRDGAAKGLLALQTNGGTRVWEYSNLLHNSGGTPIVVGAARDVTERVHNQRVLRASEGRFATAQLGRESAGR